MIELLLFVEEYVRELFEKDTPKNLVYHKLNHTIEVVEAATDLGRRARISDLEMEILIISAWFHDTGYLYTYTNHEDESIRIAKEFLRKQNFQEQIKRKV